jgi:hypothetical protein
MVVDVVIGTGATVVVVEAGGGLVVATTRVDGLPGTVVTGPAVIAVASVSDRRSVHPRVKMRTKNVALSKTGTSANLLMRLPPRSS